MGGASRCRHLTSSHKQQCKPAGARWRHEQDRTRSEQRSQARLERDSARRIRRLAITLVSDLAELDPTVSGATFISAAGELEYISAEIFRRGGKA
jgi:hypothetical protein